MNIQKTCRQFKLPAQLRLSKKHAVVCGYGYSIHHQVQDVQEFAWCARIFEMIIFKSNLRLEFRLIWCDCYTYNINKIGVYKKMFKFEGSGSIYRVFRHMFLRLIYLLKFIHLWKYILKQSIFYSINCTVLWSITFSERFYAWLLDEKPINYTINFHKWMNFSR